ncbi:MAG TPA: MBL fold metallo-hydrolase [Thermoanaerobaculia bacterium]|nr:MBL fold metallo-hydrolase [Thermoanaerobaculia bacterium]
MADRLYFRQLLAGRDFAQADPFAGQMVNFCYLIGDRDKGECVAVDPAWDIRGLIDAASADGMNISAALVTHYHPDHVGGNLFGHPVQGLAELQEAQPAPIHCHRAEADGVRKVTGVSTSDLILHEGGDVVRVGDVAIQLLHTPGHTPGSQCFLVDGRLVSGDTLFVQGCGRVDLPGGNTEEMYRTLTQRLATLPDDTVLYPGHHYGAQPSADFGNVRAANYTLQPRNLDDWLALMG